MRADIDTNVLLSGLIWRGTPHALIEQVRAGTLSLVSSPFILAEIVEPPPFPNPVCRDTHDDELLALPKAALPDLIVSGDNDLRILGSDAGIPVVAPTHVLVIVTGEANDV